MRSSSHQDTSNFHDVKTAAVSDALHRYGFGSPSSTLRRLLSSRLPDTSGSIWNSVKNVASEGARQTLIGDPYSAYRELRALTHMSGGNVPKAVGAFMLGNYYRKPNNLGTHISNAINLYGVGRDLGDAAFTSDPERRNADLGSAATRLLMRPFTSRLGLAGIPVDMAANQGVRWLMDERQRPLTNRPLVYPSSPVENAGSTV